MTTHIMWWVITNGLFPIDPTVIHLSQLIAILASFVFFYIESSTIERLFSVKGFLTDLFFIMTAICITLTIVFNNEVSVFLKSETGDGLIVIFTFMLTTIFVLSGCFALIGRLSSSRISFLYVGMAITTLIHTFCLAYPYLFGQPEDIKTLHLISFVVLSQCCAFVSIFLFQQNRYSQIKSVRRNKLDVALYMSICTLAVSVPSGMLINFLTGVSQPNPQMLMLTIALCMFFMSMRFIELIATITRARNRYFLDAHYDPLTKVYNRRGLLFSLENSPFDGLAIFCVDIDDFKSINDEYGHIVGDKLLVEIAIILKEVISHLPPEQEDKIFIARMGGDEFLVAITSDDIDVETLAECCHSKLKGWIEVDGVKLYSSASFGVSLWHPSSKFEQVFRAADIAMYQAKKSRRGILNEKQIQLTNIQSRQSKREVLHNALSNGQLTAYSQPICEISTGKIVGVEVLARINLDSGHLLSPANFIELVYEGGLENTFTELLLEQIPAAAAESRKLKIAINTPPQLISTIHQAKWLNQKIIDVGLSPENTTLEIIELSIENDETSASVTWLKTQGYTIALDDFGVGFSNLARLGNLPIDIVKLDKSLLSITDAKAKLLAQQTTEMAHQMGMKVTAEGIETREQFDFAKQIGVEYIQGYYIGRPQAMQFQLSQLNEILV
ncbi:putative bifunctional diguanylate cyclase/phosphodiesterase [Veronia nyctiphanis]|uniref:putative bifunctional diguanylate cyclase/phosphodiesterase n=1 Tax=Veronia nyctiphanis TaxID=1278244 RepID=UPI001375536E|nr:GGDEF domain-containing phosphodiesterase [Veronia nyctiphanis]